MVKEVADAVQSRKMSSFTLRQQNPQKYLHYQQPPIAPCRGEKNGVFITSSCTPSRQFSSAAIKRNQVLGQLLRSFTFRDRLTFVRLYHWYIRPHLEYFVQAWSPWLQQDIDFPENFQRRALNSVSGLTGSDEEKLQQRKMYSLKDLRNRWDMIKKYKTLHQIEDVDPSKFFSMSSTNHTYAARQAVNVSEDGFTTSRTWALLRGQSRLELRANFFTHLVVNTWNLLPNSIQNSKSVNAFENKYDQLFVNIWIFGIIEVNDMGIPHPSSTFSQAPRVYPMFVKNDFFRSKNNKMV